MKNVSFKQKIEEKVNESLRKRISIDKNKEQNKIVLKEKMINKIEERLLNAVPSYAKDKELSLTGPLFFVNEKDSKFYIKDYYGDDMVLFDDIDEIKRFVEDIITEFDGGLRYEITLYEKSLIDKASIWFKYEYKES